MSAIPLSGVIAGPISGELLKRMTGIGGLRAWQWLFLVEGIPSAIAGLVTMIYLTDRPARAKWLEEEERSHLIQRLQEEEALKKSEGQGQHRLVDAMRSGRVWLCCAVYFGFQMGSYGLWFWLPQILEDTVSRDPWRIGLVSAIPWAASAIAMIVYAHHSDETGEQAGNMSHWERAPRIGLRRRRHGGTSGAGAVTLVMVSAVESCADSPFSGRCQRLPCPARRRRQASPGSTRGKLAGYLSPFLIGYLRDTTGTMTWAYLVLAGSCIAAAAIAWTLKPAR